VRFTHLGTPTFAHVVDPKENGDLDEFFKADIATGNPVDGTIVLTGEIVTVERQTLLAPVANVPIVVNTGLNYKDHVTESLFFKGDLFPPNPYIFYRPGTSIAPPFPAKLEVYHVQQECLDYEGELVFQTGNKALLNVSKEEAAKNIIGFSVGNDFSPRPGKVLGPMNFIFSKGFDDWTPVGPILVHPSVVGVPPTLDVQTKWKGEVVQKDNTKNMIFDVAQILSSMSIGTTVQPGTVVFSGTCGGGAWFRDQGKSPGIQSGDEVEVRIDKIGTIRAFPKFIDI